ncbi:MAG TPA: hypothetical protein VFM61_08030 [Pseudidiomarina sp.]|nr:hypothetical protein [Pseudidiomarina sp.]
MKHLGLMVSILLVGCAMPQRGERADTERVDRQRTLLAHLEKYKHADQMSLEQSNSVTETNQFYVPPLASVDDDQPSWFAQPQSSGFRDVPAHIALTEVLSPVGVTYQFHTPQLADALISTERSQTLGDFIRALERSTGWYIAADQQGIEISEFRVAEFDVSFLAGDTDFFLGNSGQQNGRSQMASNSRAQPLSSTNEQFLNFSSSDLSVWSDLDRALRLLLSESGQLSINQSSTSVLVRDYPHHVAAVERYLKQQNERLTRQVTIEVQILDVTFTDEEQFSVDWQALVQTAGGEGVLGLTAAAVRGIGSTDGAQISWQQQQGRAAGSKVFLEALKQQGLVRMSNHPRVVSLNNQIAKILLEDNATYLAAAGSTATANVGTTELLEPGVVTTGFELYVLPSIGDDEVILQLSTELSDLERIDEVRSGQQLIQTPHTKRKKFFMKALIKDGQTLLLSGLRNEREQWLEQKSWLSTLLGGGHANLQRHSETLVLLTPRIVAQVQP